MGAVNGRRPLVIYTFDHAEARVATQADIDNLINIARAYAELTGINPKVGRGVMNRASRK